MEKLTESQKKVLSFIQRFTKKYGHTPSLYDIKDFIGSPNIGTAQYYVEVLVRKGYLRRVRQQMSTTELVE